MSRIRFKKRKHQIKIRQKRKKKLAQLRQKLSKSKAKEKVFEKVSKIAPWLSQEEFLSSIKKRTNR